MNLAKKVSILIFLMALTTFLSANVPLYGVFEAEVTNSNSYNNPFNYEEIELQAKFRAPSGKEWDFWGFYDGNGNGGSGNKWKLRFMPDETGDWTYTYSWTDGTNGGSGSFTVDDSDIPGPAKLNPDNNTVIIDSRGNPLHWKGYGLHHTDYKTPYGVSSANEYISDYISDECANGRYNVLYWCVPNGDQSGTPLWGDFSRYELPAAVFTDRIIQACHERNIWVISWITFCMQERSAGRWSTLWGNERYKALMRWFVGRYAAYYNFFHWSICWEVQELDDWVNRNNVMMTYLQSIDPWKRLQGTHDRAKSSWQGWQSIQARQMRRTTLESAATRTTGVDGNISPYEKVVFASEDNWGGSISGSRSNEEIRRNIWGSLFGNVMPLYVEHNKFGFASPNAEEQVQIAYDWWFSRVDYQNSNYSVTNNLSNADLCASVPGKEYVAYRKGNGNIEINLSGAQGAFDVSWIDPVSGNKQDNHETVSGGSNVTLQPPINGNDLVVLVKNKDGATISDRIAFSGIRSDVTGTHDRSGAVKFSLQGRIIEPGKTPSGIYILKAKNHRISNSKKMMLQK